MMEHTKNKFIYQFLCMLIILTFSYPVYANAGIPMLVIMMPGFILMFIPIVILESFYLTHKFKIKVKKSFKVVTLSNLVSTIIGIPLSWIILVMLQLLLGGGGVLYDLNTVFGKFLAVTVQAPWMLPINKGEGWMILIAAFFLLFIFFFVSWMSEFYITKYLLRNDGFKRLFIRNVVLFANLFSYSFLVLYLWGYYLFVR